MRSSECNAVPRESIPPVVPMVVLQNHQNAVHRQASSQPVRNVRSASASILEYPHRLHWRWRFLPANFLSTGFRMISTTSPTVRRWCVFCVTCRTSKTARKAHICGSSRVATLCVTSAPLASAQAGGELRTQEQASPTASHAHPALQTRHGTSCVPLRCEMCRPQGCGRSTPHVAYTPLHARQSLSAPGRVVLFHHRPRHRRVVLPVPLVYGPTTARARCRAEHLRLCPSRSMD